MVNCPNLADIYCDYTYVYKKEIIEGEDTIPSGVTWHYGDLDASLYRYFNWTVNSRKSVVCDGLKYEIDDDMFEIPYSFTTDKHAHRNSSLDSNNSYEIVGFGADAFKGELRITNLDLAESVRSISSGAFADCTNITEVHLPSTMEYIYDNAFSNCTGIQTAYYNGTLEKFLESSLYNAWTDGNDSLKNAHWIMTDYEGGFPEKAAVMSVKKKVDLSEYEEMILDSEINLYADKDTDSEVLEKLKCNSKVYIISSEEKDNGIWYEIYTSDETRGWIFIENSGVEDEESTETEESAETETEESGDTEEAAETETATEEVAETENEEDSESEEDTEDSSQTEDSTADDADTSEDTESALSEESVEVESVEEIIIEEDGENIPDKGDSNIPEVKIESEVKDEE